MKALSLWQPWATLMAIGAKTIETRCWAAPLSLIGQDVVIHAAKNVSEMSLCHAAGFSDALKAAGYTDTNQLPLGAALCIARLVDCCRTDSPYLSDISDRERLFGNYDAGRFGWRFENLRRFTQPIQFRGMQGVFEIPNAAIEGAL